MINYGSWALDHKRLIYFFIIMLGLGGAYSFYSMSKLEDPEIKVKDAVILTLYPGASPHEVELEVSDPIERNIRSLKNVGHVRSISMNDASLVRVRLSTLVQNDEVEQSWDMLRKKVRDAAVGLPNGVKAPIVIDNIGDVYGMFYALVYEDYDNEEASKYADLIKRNILKIEGISDIVVYGEEPMDINIDLYEDKIANLGIHPTEVLATIKGQNETTYSGYFESGDMRFRLSVNDRYKNVEDIKNLVLQGHEGDQLRLKDIAKVYESYASPRRKAMYRDGKAALGIAISAKSGTDITKIGKEVEEVIEKLSKDGLPAGMELEKVFFQPERVEDALSNFMLNLLESVLIVVLILIFSMGLRSGLILGINLGLTVIITIQFLSGFDGTMQRVSLAAFILAMGMLVDNAIVILDGIQTDMEQGKNRRFSLTNIGQKTAMPLLGATLIAILAFLPIFLSPDTAGIYVRDLFIVLAISLLASWVLALFFVPIQAERMLKVKKEKQKEDPYQGFMYRGLKMTLSWVLCHRLTTIGLGILGIILSLFAFPLIPQGFFPDMDYDQLYIEYRLPDGLHTKRVEKDLQEIEQYLKQREDIKHITRSVGATPARYNLVRSIATPSLAYGELIVDFSSADKLAASVDEIQAYLSTHYPDAQVRVKRYNLMYKEYPIELEFSGPDPAILHRLSDSALMIMRRNPNVAMARVNWFPKVPVLNIQYDQAKARTLGLKRQDIALSVLSASEGIPMGTFHKGGDKRTIKFRTVDKNGEAIESLDQTPVFSVLPSLQNLGLSRKKLQAIAMGSENKEDLLSELLSTNLLSQATDGIKLSWEESAIIRENGQRAIRTQCSPITGYSNESLRQEIAKEVAKQITLPEGYEIKWEGEYSASVEAKKYLFHYYPLAVVLMLAILIMLFGGYRKPAIILLCLPFLSIGVVLGMLVSGKTFGFVAIVAILGLIGMLIKNGIVLIDEIVHLLNEGVKPIDALISSAMSRFRPVMLASLTTILGMIPLLSDSLFGSAAVVIMAGLLVGTLITLIFIPLLYALLYGIKVEDNK